MTAAGTRGVADAVVPRQGTFPVVECFGPTVQGEGPATGERCWFLRLGGCDYRCAWCDSMHAVEPALVRQAEKLTPLQIIARLWSLGMGEGDLLVVSGGNPALHQLDRLLDALPDTVRVHVETQGTVHRPWLDRCELVVVSPKPPSAWGQHPAKEAVRAANVGLGAARQFVARLAAPWALKVVVFDEADLSWAQGARVSLLQVATLPGPVGCYLSAGTPQEARTREGMVQDTVRSFAWLANQAVERPDMAPWRIGLQMHVLAWPGELER